MRGVLELGLTRPDCVNQSGAEGIFTYLNQAIQDHKANRGSGDLIDYLLRSRSTASL